MTCTNFQVESMKSSFTPSSGLVAASNNNPSIQMDLNGISANCTGKYDVSGIGMSGNIVASMSSLDTPLHLQVDIASSPLKDIKKSKNNSNKVKVKDNVDGETNQEHHSSNQTSSLPFPSKASLSSCQCKLSIHDLQFTGSASAKIIDLFSGMISKQVTSALNDAVCPLIK